MFAELHLLLQIPVAKWNIFLSLMMFLGKKKVFLEDCGRILGLLSVFTYS